MSNGAIGTTLVIGSQLFLGLTAALAIVLLAIAARARAGRANGEGGHA